MKIAPTVRTLILAALTVLTSAGASASSGTAPENRYFASPEAAVEALVAAVRNGDPDALIAVLGPGSQRLVDSGDAVSDRAGRERFVARFDETHEILPVGDSRAEFEVGNDDWPFPIPLVKEAGGWRYDVAAGEDEILNRRIGENELSTVEVCLALVDAQREYYLSNPAGADLPHYARQFRSDPGQRNGLYWETGDDEAPSPLGPFFAAAVAEGYSHGTSPTEPQPYHGYFFRILTRQGPDAPGGEYDYLVRDMLIGGFAAVAWPAEYGTSGITTFLVNHDGVVYESDLGPDTRDLALAMTAFNPDSTWIRVDRSEP
jgi:hypothetical protein